MISKQPFTFNWARWHSWKVMGLLILSLTTASCGPSLPGQKMAEPQLPISTIVGVGIVGDSNSDEYQADDNRGGDDHEHTLNWVEQVALSRKLNVGEWGSWEEPRRNGFAYNWARSGATAASMIASGQHTGLAAQVAAGEVSHVVIYIGTNDFSIASGFYEAVYAGNMSAEEVQNKIEQFTADVTTAVDTILAAGDAHIILVNLADPSMQGEVAAQFPEAEKRQHVSDVIQTINGRLQTMAAEREITIIDMAQLGAEMLSRVGDDGKFHFGGESFILAEKGDDPHHLRLGDQSGHPGTIASGMLANMLLLKPLRQVYGVDIEPLSELEILQNAGLR